LDVNLKERPDMALIATCSHGEPKRMKRLAFAFAGVAALTLAGCNSSNQDQVNNAELNQPTTDELNQAASDAANDAANAEAAALGQQEKQLQANTDDNSNPSDDQEQNVAGM
jgi:predicted component of type VI protein secretion system